MMERDPKSIYDLQPMILDDIGFESRFEGSCHLMRECNMLYLLDNRTTAAGGEEDDAFLISFMPEERAEYE